MIDLNMDENKDGDDDDDYMQEDDEINTNIPISPKNMEPRVFSNPIGTGQYPINTEMWKDFAIADISEEAIMKMEFWYCGSGRNIL